MRRMRKLVGLLLAMVMVLAMTTTAFAADVTTPATYKISAPAVATGKVAHTYEVYQIFTGDLHKGVLSNVKWGKNGTGTEKEKVSKDILDVLEVAAGTDEAKLAVITDYVNWNTTPYGTVKSGGELLNVPAGYYLIKDQSGSLDGKDDAYTTYIVEVVDNVTISPKSAKPTVDKQVWDEVDDAEANAVEGWGESADHSMNESFQFKLKATLPADTDFTAYKTYKVVFNDTMSAGITFESIASVKVNGTTVTNYTCTAGENQAGGSWKLTIDDIKPYVGGATEVVVEVVYNAHLNENAVIGNDPSNNNTVYLQYSNNPNADGFGGPNGGGDDDGNPDDGDTPGGNTPDGDTPGGDTSDEDLGKTEPDTVWVFTYEMPNKKVDGETKEPLKDAGFKLYAADGTEIGLIYDANKSAYRPIKSDETAVEEMKSAADGTFKVVGLDAGTYVLKEETTPAGYNTCPDITIEISAVHAENEAGTSATTTITMKQNGTVTTLNTIENNKGTVLPETGGMGTTIFYLIGAILVIGSAVVMITRKRMSR